MNPWTTSFEQYRQEVLGETKKKSEKESKDRWQDDDGDGKWYEKSDTDGKISDREKKEKKKNVKENKNCCKKCGSYEHTTKECTIKEGIEDIIARLEKKRISKGGNPDESPLGKKTGRAMKAKQDEVRKKAGVKTEEVENLDELKTSTLRSYANKASIEAVGRGVDAGVKGMTGPKKEMEKNMTKAYKRQQGINRAVNKLASRAERNEEVVYEGDVHSGQGEKVQKRTKAWMDKKGQKGAPGLDAMKARTAEHNAKRGVKEAYRVLASSDGQEKPSQFSYKDEKTAKKYVDSIKKGGGKATIVKEDIGSFKDYMANVEAAKKRQKDKEENRKRKSDAYIERVRKGIKFYDAKGSGRMVKGKKVYDKK